jgi:hypothetical protein
MNEKETLLLVGGAIVLYLLYQQSKNVNPAQIALNTNQLQAANTVANTQAIASAAQAGNTAFTAIEGAFTS